MANYTKLFNSILDSTVWCESNETRILWFTLLAMSDKYGEISAAIPGLANRARLTIEQTQSGIALFLGPDKFSRTPDFEGRRIEVIPGGWRLLNHAKYRALLSADERREYFRLKKREYRARDKESVQDMSTQSTNVRDMSTQSTHTEAEAEADTDTEKKPLESSKTASTTPPPPISDKEFQEAWNGLGKPFPKIAEWSKKRKTAFQTRIRDVHFLGNWKTALEKIRVSEFCMGINNRGWIADADFFLRPDTVLKTIEGKYDNHPHTNGNGKLPKPPPKVYEPPPRINTPFNRLDDAKIAVHKLLDLQVKSGIETRRLKNMPEEEMFAELARRFPDAEQIKEFYIAKKLFFETPEKDRLKPVERKTEIPV